MRSALPLTIFVLFFASPVLSQSTSLNDPFRAITAQAQKDREAENPICCLKPLTPSEPVDDGVLLSFEEWKMKQLGLRQASAVKAEEQETAQRTGNAVASEGSTGSWDLNKPSEPAVGAVADINGVTDSALFGSQGRSNFSPSKAPLTDRFNYASLDCSARVHTAHRSAKSTSSILSSKRDKYMLSPCDTANENQHVVVELCDDIRIDTIQMANFEFFSGVFKDFTVSVAKTYANDPDAWTTVQTYRAKNVRGVQTFRPPDDLLEFYRFIRIDFHSHYGNEYYCPVSLLRVYGLTHLEEWKWDIWESESRAKQAELQKRRHLPSTTIVVIPTSSPDIQGSPSIPYSITKSVASTIAYSSDLSLQSPTVSPPLSSPSTVADHDVPFTPFSKVKESHHHSLYSTDPFNTITEDSNDFNFQYRPTDIHVSLSVHTQHIPKPSNPEDHVSLISSPITPSSTESHNPSTSQSHLQSAPQPSSSTQSSSSYSTLSPSETPVPTFSSEPPSAVIIPAAPAHPTAKGGESIYRTILNRLAEVEMNQTLFMRYIEQQNLALRNVMKRLVEDVGRLEGITRAHTLNYERNLESWHKQKSQLEMEYIDLAMRVELLSEEIVLEKRLGVAQLCLLLAVLVFMGLTRGSRAEAFLDHSSNRLNRSVRQWGGRHLKLSNNWTDRFKSKKLSIDVQRASSGMASVSAGSRSRSASPIKTPKSFTRPKPVSAKTYPVQTAHRRQDFEEGIQFPSSSKIPSNGMDVNMAPAYTDVFPRARTRTLSNSNPRSRAPSLRSTPVNRRIHHQRPNTPISTVFRPQMLQRSSSHHGSSGSVSSMLPTSASWGVSKSAKKWARTAHLHVVGTVKRPRKRSLENTMTEMPSRAVVSGKRSRERDKESAFTTRNGNLGAEVTAGKNKEWKRGSGDEDSDAFAEAKENAFQGRDPVTFENSLLFKPTVDCMLGEEGDVWVDTDSINGSELDAC